MRLAFVGKGGVGKSAIAGTFCRALARRGHPVLAVDSDPLPGLAFSLGLAVDDAPIPEEAIQEKAEGDEGPRFRLRDGLSVTDAIEQYAATAPDGIRFLQFGKARGQSRAQFKSQWVFRQIVRDLPEDRWNVVGDLPGGTRQPFNGWGDYARTVLIVVEPTAKSLLTARRLSRLALHGEQPRRILAVANKVREEGDVDTVAERTGLEVVGAVPWDEALAAAEQQRAAPIDLAPSSAAVRAVESLVEQFAKELIA